MSRRRVSTLGALVVLALSCDSEKGAPSSTGAPRRPSSALSVTSAAPSASAPAVVSSAWSPAPSGPLPLGDSSAMRMRIHGAAVFVARRSGDEGPSLYALSFNGSPPEARRIVKGEATTNISEVAIDPTARTVLYIVDRGESAVGKTGEIWAVPLQGGEPNRVARCTTSCRGAGFLHDGRVVYVDHGIGLTNATVRVVQSRPGAPVDSAVLFGGGKELSTCSLTLAIDLDARRLVVNANNELGWECAIDATWVLGPGDLKPRKLPRPQATRGYCTARPGDDGRVYFSGTECAPSGSIANDGTDPKFPDPNLVGDSVPTTQWSLLADGDRIIATPPTKSRDVSFVVHETENLGALAYRAR